MDDRVWLATQNPNALCAIDVADPARVATTIETGAAVNLGSTDRQWLWTTQWENGFLQRRSHDGAVVDSVYVVENPTGLVLDIDDVWVSPSHFTDPVIRVAKDSLVSTAMPWRDDNIAHVVGVTTDAIWLGESQGFDNSTLVRLDRATGNRRVILSAPNSSPYLFADEAVWVAGYPEAGMTIFDSLGGTQNVVTAPRVAQMQATEVGVFVLGYDRGDNENQNDWADLVAQSRRTRLERRGRDGKVIASITVEDAKVMAASRRAVWVAVVADPDAHQIEVVTLEPETLREVGRVTVPGEFPVLIPADPETATSTW